MRWKNGCVSIWLTAGVMSLCCDEVHEPVGVEVGHPDRLDQALAVQLLHGAPGAVVVAEGLVDEVQVEVVQAEALQGLVELALGGVLAGVLDPHLGGDEQLVARDAALGDRAADGFLVAVGGGGVDRPVAGGERVGDDLLGLLVGDLEDAEAEDRHLDAVVERDQTVLCGQMTPSLVDDEFLPLTPRNLISGARGSDGLPR